jgi:hypothetical protein
VAAKKKPARKLSAKKPAAKKKPQPAKPKAAPRPVRAKPPLPPPPNAYERFRDQQAQISRDRSKAGREIGPLPPVANPERRERGRKSLLQFCRDYFPERFRLPFAECHLTTIAEMEACTSAGGLLACAMPRGSGKTAIAECAVLHAVLYGLQRFAVLAQATQPLAAKSLKKIKRELETNPRLQADFPEVCYPIARLERIHHRANGQTLDGQPTLMEWTAEGVTLPTVPGSAASGATLTVTGIESAARGLSVIGPKGEIIRPGLLLIDDAQTRETARSPVQTEYRESIITDDMMGMVGPGETMALLILCTVIYPGDLSERFLSPKRHPEFRRVRTKMLESFPASMELWDQYADIRRESLRSGDEGKRATEFYRERRKEMDAGARVSWPERVRKGELSGIQSAMNLYIDSPRTFKAEYQNEPDPIDLAAAKELQPALVAARLSGLPRFEVPREASRLAAFIDVGGELLWYAVAAWDGQFGGAVVDYGSWPRQARGVFAATDPRPGLSDRHPGKSETERVYAGLAELTTEILGRTYYREGTGEQLRVERCLIDCGWQSSTVYRFIRESPYATSIYPSKGIGRTTTARGVSEWKPRPGEQSGFHWRLTMSETGRGRMVQFDPDAWKSFLYERLTTAPGGRGGLNLHGKAAGEHEMIAQHCAAEAADPVTMRGATFDKWTVRPHQPDNHLFDALVGCCLAAGVLGLQWCPTATPPDPKPKTKRRWSEIYERKHGKASAGAGN